MERGEVLACLQLWRVEDGEGRWGFRCLTRAILLDADGTELGIWGE